MRTALRAKAFPGEDPLTLPTPADVAPLFVDLAANADTANGSIVRFGAWKRSQLALTSSNDA
jgi:hypothetical protein